jgi:hypothetical protein
MTTEQIPRVLNDHELARTMRRIDGFVPLERSELAHLKSARRQILSRAYVALSYLGIVTIIFSFTYLHILLGKSSNLFYVLPRMSAALGVVLVLLWLAATERITWRMWAAGFFGLFIMCYLIA